VRAGPLALLTVGLLLGLRHATDSDHLVALATVLARRRGLRAALATGAAWGLGHTATVLVVGGGIIAFDLSITPRLALSLEMGVAVMLILLGALNLARGAHPPARHRIAASHQGRPVIRPLEIGAVHGLAGSAAVALLVLATIRDALWSFVYLALFGLGTILGMMALTAAMAMPLSAISRRVAGSERALAATTGALSLSFGLFLVYRLGVVDGLFSGSPSWSPR